MRTKPGHGRGQRWGSRGSTSFPLSFSPTGSSAKGSTAWTAAAVATVSRPGYRRPGSPPVLPVRVRENGISPLRFPPVKGEVIRVNSHVHDPDGITTEEPATTRAMADKRQKKMAVLHDETEGMTPVTVTGNRTADTAILCWGSTKGICEELGTAMGLRVSTAGRPLAVPGESVRRGDGWRPEVLGCRGERDRPACPARPAVWLYPGGKILKYDGRPFFVDELETETAEGDRMTGLEPNTLISRAKNLWCPGCGNFAVQHALKEVLAGSTARGTRSRTSSSSPASASTGRPSTS